MLIVAVAVGQTFTGGKWAIETAIQAGQIIKHSPKIKYIPKGVSYGAEITFLRKNYGEKSWHRGMNFPETGVTLQYFKFYEDNIFGDAIALMLTSKFYIARTKYINFYARLSGGYAWLTKPYHEVKNPINNAIGSHFNIAAQLRFGAEFKLHPMVWMNAAFSFTHFSNGSLQLPNYGINIPSGVVGFKVFPQLTTVKYDCTKVKPKKRHEIQLQYSLGIHERYGLNGVKYPVHSGSVGYNFYTSPGNKVMGGYMYEYYASVRDFLTVQELSKNPDKEATAHSLYIGDELKFGRVGFYLTAGVYLQKKQYLGSLIYTRIGGRIYFAEIGKNKQYKIYGGSGMKAHNAIADYFEINGGVCAGF